MFAKEAVENEGGVETPVAGVVVDEDGVDLETVVGCRGVNWSREGMAMGGFVVVMVEGFREGPDGGVGVKNVRGDQDVFEAVSVLA